MYSTVLRGSLLFGCVCKFTIIEFVGDFFFIWKIYKDSFETDTH